MRIFLYIILLSSASILLGSNCTHTDKNSLLTVKAMDCFSEFIATNDSSHLYKAQEFINQMEDNPNYYNIAKLSLFCHLKEFDKASKYLETLNDDVFPVKYQKSIGINTYKAFDAEMRNDSVLKKEYLYKNIQIIQNHIDTLSAADFNSYYDLFLFKYQLNPSEETHKEFLNSMKNIGVPDQEIEILYQNIKSLSIINIANPFFESEENITEAKVVEMTEEDYIKNTTTP